MSGFTFGEIENPGFIGYYFFRIIQHMLMQHKLVLLFIFHRISDQNFLFFPRAVASLRTPIFGAQIWCLAYGQLQAREGYHAIASKVSYIPTSSLTTARLSVALFCSHLSIVLI